MSIENSRDNAVSTQRAVVFHYSQTGQLTDAVDAFTAPLAAAGWRIRHVAVRPATPYPFPWTVPSFFGVFPACVDEQAEIALATPDSEFRAEPGELIVFAYQVWYLAPSVPMRTVLNRHPELFEDREVISVVACRKMWHSAVLEVDHRPTALGSQHLGAVVATDTRPQFITLVTTLRWTFGGRRGGRGPLGRAGVDDRELARLRECGRAWAIPDATVVGAPVVYPVAGADLMAGRLFRRWGRMIRAGARRSPVLGALAVGAFVGWLGLSLTILPLGVLLALPLHRRLDRAIDRALGDIPTLHPPAPADITTLRPPDATETVDTSTAALSPGDPLPAYPLRRDTGAETTVTELCETGLLLLCDAESEPVWRDAVGYARIMDATPIAALAVSRTPSTTADRLHYPAGAALAGYGLHNGAAVLVRADGIVAAVLRGGDPHQELIRAIDEAAQDTRQPEGDSR
ncbi:hypothetical protein [Nocardia crassostreae]|uniref:hypothetical protein n=1 Tax=Nocardia crassostreae TaxID=53428 RepID=UPI00083149E6|nr:hypothetical protein [Nocardia crassostreae]